MDAAGLRALGVTLPVFKQSCLQQLPLAVGGDDQAPGGGGSSGTGGGGAGSAGAAGYSYQCGTGEARSRERGGQFGQAPFPTTGTELCASVTFQAVFVFMVATYCQ